MTSSLIPTTATVILGGGGAVGIGWQVGLLLGLREHGIDLGGADTIFGTSAGSVVGALLAGRRDISHAVTNLGGLTTSMPPATLKAGNDAFLDLVRHTDLHSDTQKALTEIGHAAQSANPISESAYVGLFDFVATDTWPETFSCTAINTTTGALTVWDHTSGTSLQAAVAASCALPMLFPVVTVDGRTYFDGGLASHLNATAAPESDLIIALSCHPLTAPADGTSSALTFAEVAAARELEQLSSRSRVIAVEPVYGDIGVSPKTMMDPSVARLAVQAGINQSVDVAALITPHWQH